MVRSSDLKPFLKMLVYEKVNFRKNITESYEECFFVAGGTHWSTLLMMLEEDYVNAAVFFVI